MRTQIWIAFCKPIMKMVFVLDLGTIVVLALFHSQSGLYTFMLYDLVLVYLPVCIALVSVFISLVFTEGPIVCNLYIGTPQCAVSYRLTVRSQRCCKIKIWRHSCNLIVYFNKGIGLPQRSLAFLLAFKIIVLTFFWPFLAMFGFSLKF